MSHTDKTQPWWCQVTEWKPWHGRRCFISGCTLPTHYPRNQGEAERRFNGNCAWEPVNWNEITWSRYDEWWEDVRRNRSRAKRQWRKDQGL